jgi:DNA-binding NarL/FixJ family response regulator
MPSRQQILPVSGSGFTDVDVPHERLLLFLTSRRLLSESLVQAIEREFPLTTVKEVSSMQVACARDGRSVAGIFVAMDRCDELKIWLKRLVQAHPSASVALLQSDFTPPSVLPDILQSPSVCGVLPMHLKLDVWLSVIRLMLSGGDYIPRSMFYPGNVLSADTGARVEPKAAPGEEDLQNLTERELQILGLVARGLQNKVIAATLQLSEHTVKIHLHNIITKLGTSNRTEAAAIYHRQRGGEGEIRLNPSRRQH